MTKKPISIYSPESEALVSRQDGQDLKQSPSARRTNSARRSYRRGSEGLLLTPSATNIDARSQKALAERKAYRESINRKTVPPGNLAEQIQYPFSLRDMSQSSPTSETSTEKNGGEQLSLLGGSHASRFPLPDSEEARKMTAISGRKCLELLKRQDPVGCLLKMLVESSKWHSTKCLLT